MAAKSNSSKQQGKTNFGNKKGGMAKKHVNKHQKTKTIYKDYVGQGR